jgi:hypothetical protein
MRRVAIRLAIGVASCTIVSIGCSGGTSFSYQNVTVAIAPQIKSIPVNGTQVFSTTTKNAPNVPLWSLNGNYVSGAITTGGSFTTTAMDPSSVIYTAPAVPPIYTDAQVKAGAVQGSVVFSAGVSIDPTSAFNQIVTSETFVVTGPISVGLSPSTASVQLNGIQQFAAYAVGSINNNLIWQVNGVAGGGTASGVIDSNGLYTAPSTIPMTGNTVNVTVVSQDDPTKSATSLVTLTSR